MHSDILSDIFSCLHLTFFLAVYLPMYLTIWHSIVSDILSDMCSDIYLSFVLALCLTYILTILTDILSDMLCSPHNVFSWQAWDILKSKTSFCVTGAGHRTLFHPCGGHGAFCALLWQPWVKMRGGFWKSFFRGRARYLVTDRSCCGAVPHFEISRATLSSLCACQIALAVAQCKCWDRSRNRFGTLCMSDRSRCGTVPFWKIKEILQRDLDNEVCHRELAQILPGGLL